MYGHCTHTRMARIRVIEPIMMIADKILSRFGCHTTKSHLTRIPKTVVRESHIFGICLTIQRTVTFSLVRSTTGFTIKEINIMHPAITIIRIQRDTIIHTEHNRKVSDFNTLAISQQNAESPDCSIISHSLKGDVHLAVRILSFNL